MILKGLIFNLQRKVQATDAEKLAKKDNLIYFEASTKNNINIKRLFYCSLAHLGFFEQYEKPIDKIAEELSTYIVLNIS